MKWSEMKLSTHELTELVKDVGLLQKVSTPVWNRLEGQPRSEDMQRALKAEVRDALWMLTRQWQMGEFAGDDAGTPAFANLDYHCAPFGGDDTVPLEPQVEATPVFLPRRRRCIRWRCGCRWVITG